MRNLVFLGVFASALAVSPALAADVDDSLVIEAPEVTVSGDRSGVYIAARLAAAFADDTNFGLTIVDTNIANEYKNGASGSIAMGYRFSNMFSAELEVGMTKHSIEAHTLDALSARLDGEDAFGTTKINYGLVNVAAEYETGMAIRPYLSAGIGLASVEFENHGVTLAAPVGALPAGNVTALSEKDSGVAYQLGGGVVVDITDKIGLEAGYRYFNVDGIELSAVDGTVSEVKINQHQALFGIRYSF